MKFTNRFRYGLRALSVLAAHYGDRPVSAKTISEMEELSPSFLEQLLARLRRGGIVVGVRGPGGGFRLARPPEQIDLEEIVRHLEGPLRVAKCIAEDGTDSGDCARVDECAAVPLLRRLRKDINTVLGSYTLADIACDVDDDIRPARQGKGRK